MDGDPNADSFGDAGRLPACCWMHMDERARMELKTKLGRDWDAFRRAWPTGRGAPMFLPSPELLEQFALVPAGFTVNWLRGPFIGLRDAAEDVRKAKEEEERRAQPEVVVDGGADSGTDSGAGATPEVNASAEASAESAPVAVDERPATGSPEGAAVLAESEHESASGGETTAVSPAAGLAKKKKRTGSKSSKMLADVVVDLDAWTKEHREVLELCRIDIDELLSILRAPDCRLRVSRKKHQVALPTAEEPAQAST